MTDNLNWAYMAGFFDGEGHVAMTTSVGRRQVVVMMAQSKEVGRILLSDIQKWLSDQGIRSVLSLRKDDRPNISPSYSLDIKGRGSYMKFLKLMLPWLRVKKVAAQDIIRYHTLWPSLKEGAVGSLLAKERCKKHGLVRNFKRAANGG